MKKEKLSRQQLKKIIGGSCFTCLPKTCGQDGNGLIIKCPDGCECDNSGPAGMSGNGRAKKITGN